MATDDEVQKEGMTLLVTGIKALAAFLDGKAFFQIETDVATPPSPAGTVRRIRFMRDPA